MNSMTQGLLGQLQGQPMNLLGQRLGLGQHQLSGLLAAAAPLLIGALGREARQPAGARSLFGALQRDHMGQDPQSVLGSALEGGQQGDKILGHIFGEREALAAQGVAGATGVAPDRARMLLRWLAPVAMAYVAKQLFERRQQGASVLPPQPPSPDLLQHKLEQEERQIQQNGGIGGGLLHAVLDRNKDGELGFSDLLGGFGGFDGPPPGAPREAGDGTRPS